MASDDKSRQNMNGPGAPSRRDVVISVAIALPGLTIAGCTEAPSQLTPSETGDRMEKVTGIGGFFFRAEDPTALGKWYKDNLGVELAPQLSGGAPWQQEAGFTVFDPFTMDNPMIPEGKTWMINFRVGNLARMIEQLRAAGVEVGDLEEYPHGKFTQLSDPEGNGIQLWEVASM